MWTVSGGRGAGSRSGARDTGGGSDGRRAVPDKKTSLPGFCYLRMGVGCRSTDGLIHHLCPFPLSPRGGCHLAPEVPPPGKAPSVQSHLLEGLCLMPPPLGRPLLTYRHSLFLTWGRNNVSSGSPSNPQALTWQTLALETYLSSE